MNTPNKLTLLRTLMVPIFIIFMYLDFNGSRIIATLIFAIASFTDFLDGYLARRDNLVTNFGKFADPLADKILVCSAMIMLVSFDEIPAWAVIIIIAREFTITGFRIIAASINPQVFTINISASFGLFTILYLSLFRREYIIEESTSFFEHPSVTICTLFIFIT